MKGIATNRWPWSSEAGRAADEKTTELFLREAAAAGYEAVEVGPADIADVAATRHGEIGALAICGSYVGLPLHERWDSLTADDAVLAPARALAEHRGSYVAVNADPKGGWGRREAKSDDDLKRQGENLTRLADALAPLGLALVFHNHANTAEHHAADLRSVTEFAAESVGIMLDTGWALVSGDDPVARARELGGRLRALHLRNHRGEPPTEWLGEGDMDVAALVNTLKAIGYDGWLTVELWHRDDVATTRSLVDDQRRSVALLKQLWGLPDQGPTTVSG